MITLYTAATPNGHKASIMLEELGIEYNLHHIQLSEGDQKQDWYMKLNPNGRIPTIVDHDNDDYAVFESGAILLYLADKFGKFIPRDEKARFEVIQWLFFQMANVGPYQGQANVFYRYAPEKIDYAIQRYQGITHDNYVVLDKQLEGKDYLCGDYSIADMATFPWVFVHDWAGVSLDGLDNVQQWVERMFAREGVKRGLDIPTPLVEILASMQESDGKDVKEMAQKILQNADKK